MTKAQMQNGRGTNQTTEAAKRVSIVSVKLCRESSILHEPRCIRHPGDVARLVEMFLADSDREKIVAVCLDTKHQPTAISTVSIGTLNSSMVHPREVFKTAILSNSAAIILAHNHPSGKPEPSKDDIDVTKRLVRAGEIIGIDVLDHVIIGGNDNYQSIRELGIVEGMR